MSSMRLIIPAITNRFAWTSPMSLAGKTSSPAAKSWSKSVCLITISTVGAIPPGFGRSSANRSELQNQKPGNFLEMTQITCHQRIAEIKSCRSYQQVTERNSYASALLLSIQFSSEHSHISGKCIDDKVGKEFVNESFPANPRF